MMRLTPVMPAIESSIFLATWVSSSAGAAPDWVTLIETTGTSMLGKRVTGNCRKLTKPTRQSTMNSKMAGIGLRME